MTSEGWQWQDQVLLIVRPLMGACSLEGRTLTGVKSRTAAPRASGRRRSGRTSPSAARARHASCVAHGALPPLAARRVRRSDACCHATRHAGTSPGVSVHGFPSAVLASVAAREKAPAARARSLTDLLSEPRTEWWVCGPCDYIFFAPKPITHSELTDARRRHAQNRSTRGPASAQHSSCAPSRCAFFAII